MITPSNALPEPHLDSQSIAPAVTAPTQPLYWSVRRELWENRSVYLAPLAVSAVYLFGFLINLALLAHRMRKGLLLDPAQQQAAFETPYNVAAVLIMATILVLQVFYCLDALYGERRDRSILFWKSLPVSNLTAVLAKASIPVLILPLLGFAITAITQLIVRLLTSAVLLGSGLHVATRWTQLSFIQVSLGLLYHLVSVHGFWYAPFYGWLLLVSAWAPRAPFLWAILPPLAVAGFEKLVFDTSHFAALLQYRFSGPEMFNFMAPGSGMDPLQHVEVLRFLSTPGLWTGLGLFAIFLIAAARLRRDRGPT